MAIVGINSLDFWGVYLSLPIFWVQNLVASSLEAQVSASMLCRGRVPSCKWMPKETSARGGKVMGCWDVGSKLARLVNRFQRKGEKTSLWLHTTTMFWLISSVHRMNSCSIMPFRIFVYLCNKLGRFFVFSVLPPMLYQSSHQTISHVHC